MIQFTKIVFMAICLLISSHLFAQTDANTSPIAKKNFHITGSAGFGFPAIIGFALYIAAGKDIEPIKSTLPFMGKIEFSKKKWGAGITYTTNFQQAHFTFPNTNPKSIDNITVNTWSISTRGNYYIINKDYKHQGSALKRNANFQWYIGAGVGYIKAIQTTNNITYNTKKVKSNLFEALPISFEATTGTRYFINKYVGLFFEAGLGNFPIQLRDKGISDSYLQGGLSVRW
jgi:hypothetical protein